MSIESLSRGSIGRSSKFDNCPNEKFLAFVSSRNKRRQMNALTRLRVAPRDGTYSRTAETIEEILNATLRVLTRDGYASLTLRRVATECGLRVGNLSYHFPTKAALLKGLLDAVLQSYRDRSTKFAASLPTDKRTRLLWIVVKHAQGSGILPRYAPVPRTLVACES